MADRQGTLRVRRRAVAVGHVNSMQVPAGATGKASFTTSSKDICVNCAHNTRRQS